MSFKFKVFDNEQTRSAKQMMAWADEKINLASKGEIFNVPIGHDKFMDRVYEVREEAEDILLENLGLQVIA